MKKYYIGLLVLGVLTLGLGIFVITLGLQSRQDVKTEKAVQTISSKLNNYISTNQVIPANLSVVDVKDIPNTITYTKLSYTEYKFCVTYKAAKDYGSGDITSVLTNAAFSQVYGSQSASVNDNYPSDTSYQPSELYIDYTHKKGEVCQTIKPYINNSFNYTRNSVPTIDEYCDPQGKYYSQYKQYCNSPTTTTPKTTLQ